MKRSEIVEKDAVKLMIVLKGIRVKSSIAFINTMDKMKLITSKILGCDWLEGLL